MRPLLLMWRLHRMRVADADFELQLAAFDSGMNRDIKTLDWRFGRLVKAANAVKEAAQ